MESREEKLRRVLALKGFEQEEIEKRIADDKAEQAKNLTNIKNGIKELARKNG